MNLINRIIRVALSISLMICSSVFAQQNLSKEDKYQLIDSVIQQQIRTGEVNQKNFIRAVETQFPDYKEVIADIALSDPDAQKFLQNYNEHFWRQLITDPEAAEVYGSGKNLISAIIQRNEVTGQKTNTDWVPWAVGGTLAAVGIGLTIRAVYQVKRMQRWSQEARSVNNFREEYLRYSKDRQGLLRLHEEYHADFVKAAEGEEHYRGLLDITKKRKQLINGMLETGIDERGREISTSQREALENELRDVEKETERLKKLKNKHKKIAMRASRLIRGLNIGRWARRLPAIALFFSVGTTMWAQSSTAEQQEAMNENGDGLDRWFLNFANMPHDLLHNSNYSSSEKNKFFLYLSLVYFIERDSHDGFVSDFFMGCLSEDYEPDPLRMQRSLVDILFVEEEYENFQDARLAMAAEMKALTAKLSYEIQTQQSNNHCESPRN